MMIVMKLRFSQKEFWTAITMIAYGLGLLLFSMAPYFTSRPYVSLVSLVLWCGAGTMLGAGAMIPFKRSVEGAIAGTLVQLCTSLTGILE
jgi:hypothetical protein